MSKFQLFLNSSLPRSGSTLLQNLLAQNPEFHPTATSNVLECVMLVRDQWMTFTDFIAQGLDAVKPRMRRFCREAVYGFYSQEFSTGKSVFDKSRGWLQCLEMIEEILERPVKVVVGVRDIRDVLASLEKIYRRSRFTDHTLPMEERIQLVNIYGRTERLLRPDKLVGYMAYSIEDAFRRGLSDRLVVVPYHELTHRTVETIWRVCRELGVPEFTCNPEKILQVIREDDSIYGMSLHTIREQVEPDAGGSWEGILPDDLASDLERRFPFIQRLSRQRFLPKQERLG